MHVPSLLSQTYPLKQHFSPQAVDVPGQLSPANKNHKHYWVWISVCVVIRRFFFLQISRDINPPMEYHQRKRYVLYKELL